MLSTYGANTYAEVLCGRQSPPNVFYLALLTALPAADDSGTDIEVVEPAGASYSRVLVDFGDDSWAAPTSGLCAYQPSISYTPTEDWGTITSYALCTAVTGGWTIFYDNLLSPIVIKNGATISIPSGTLKIGVSI